MTTRLVILSAAGKRLRSRITCSTISPRVRFRSTPFNPLAQKTHPIPQPTWVLMQTVRRSSSAISTHSIRRPSRQARSSLSVPSGASPMLDDLGAEDRPFGVELLAQALGRSDITSNRSARRWKTQRSTWLAWKPG